MADDYKPGDLLFTTKDVLEIPIKHELVVNGSFDYKRTNDLYGWLPIEKNEFLLYIAKHPPLGELFHIVLYRDKLFLITTYRLNLFCQKY